ncbi:U3 small nucleolar RNA-associated protein 15 homolog [Planococcus citri]|uniref:U3 small nucleolar RNA-associated protein 15 homolog n=1 Tax=Planococcus citri TaxID=170843 RepID=UPI0031F8CE68
MTTFKKTDTKVFDRVKQVSQESLYWKKLGEPILLKEFGPIDYLNFSPVEPYNFAVTSSARVQIYNPVTKQPYKNLNKFKATAFGGTFRQDGKLLCAGSEDSMVRLFDVSTRSLLRRLKGHTLPVHRTYFTCDNNHIASFSDDKSCILWDIVTEQHVVKYKEHNDYIRAGCVSPVNPSVVVSGGYDGAIKMYDIRDKSVACTLDHGAPVESALFLPTGSILVTAGGKEVRVWDAFNRTLLATCSQYHKTVTCMCLATKGKRLLTGSLDHRVKVIDMVTYRVIHTMGYTSPILSIANSFDDKTMITGTVSGLITIQKRGEQAIVPQKKPVSYRYIGDTSTKDSNLIDTVVTMKGKDKLPKYESSLRKFEYKRALDHVMVSSVAYKTPATVIALFDELIRRKGLKQAISNRDSKQLAQILRFIIRYISVERFMKILIEVSDLIIDAYWDIIDLYSSEVKKLFNTLQDTVRKETQATEDFLKIQGALEMILAASNISLPPIEDLAIKVEAKTENE